MKYDDPLKKVEKEIKKLALLLEDDVYIQDKIIELSHRAISDVREEVGNRVWHIHKEKRYDEHIFNSWKNTYEQQYINCLLTKKEIAKIIADDLLDEYGEEIYTLNTVYRKLSHREMSKLEDKLNKSFNFIDDSDVDEGIIRVDWEKVC